MNQSSTTSAGPARGPRPVLPPTIARYILRSSGAHQLALAALSIAVFLLNTAPLELQRRIVNDAVQSGAVASIAWLALGYGGLALLEGACKLVMNIYRGWLNERAVRHLRTTIDAATESAADSGHPDAEGVRVSLILSEVEPVGGFVGISTSEPLLQGGILLSVFAYMIYLQPRIALVSLLVFAPQMVFVPLIQRAINRRVATRVQVLRDVSGGIVHADHGDAKDAQENRINVVFALNMGIYKLKFTMNFLMNLLHHLGVAVVLGVGGWYAATGHIEVGTVIAFTSGLAKVNDPWGDLVNWFRDAAVNSVKYRLIAEAVERLGRQPATLPA